jgi:hypothetical protein
VPEIPKDINSTDPEIQAILAILAQLAVHEYTARVRILNYIGARLNPDY